MTTFQIGSPTETPTSPSPISTSQIRSPSPYNYASDSEEEDNLPYPAPLPRSSFLSPDFNPQIYLSSLRNRHQTLEDLRSDLRQRSQLLNKELLDLVNDHYEDFLSLGRELEGGEVKVEGVRVGVLGFEREVEWIQRVVQGRMEEVGALLEERERVRREVVLGRGLVEVERGIEDLEVELGIRKVLDSDLEDEVDEDAGEEDPRVKKLKRQTRQCVLLSRLVEKLGGDGHPFLLAQRSRMNELRRTLLLDLDATSKQAKATKDNNTMLAILKLYVELNAEKEGVKALKGG